MPFWMQKEDPEYYDDPAPTTDELEELEDTGNVLTDDIEYYGA